MKHTMPLAYLPEMWSNAGMASLLAALTAVSFLLVRIRVRSRRRTKELANLKRGQLIRERLNDAPPPAPPVRRRETPIRFFENAGD